MKENSVWRSATIIFLFVFQMSFVFKEASAGIFGPSNFDECILDSMKGVTAEIAAKAIYVSCRNKFPEPVAPEKKRQSNAKRLVRDGIDTFAGIRLLMKEDEVRYILGKPKLLQEKNGALELHYDNPDVGGVLTFGGKVVFLMNGTVSAVLCEGYSIDECPELAGVRVRDTEENVRSSLGDPIEPVTLKDDRKILKYGPPTQRVWFVLFKDSVVEIRLSNELRK